FESRAGGRTVHIDVRYRLLAKLVRKLFTPFGRARESYLFSIPAANYQRSPGTNTLLEQRPQRSRHFHHRRCSAAWVNPSKDPGVTMVAQHDPLILQLGATYAGFDDIIGLDGIVHLDFQMNSNISAEPVAKRQSALPTLGSDGTIHVFKERLRILPGERQSHDLGQRNCLFDWNALRAWNRGPAWGQRVAWNHEVISDGAALNVALRSPRSLGEDFALLIPVLRRIAVDQDRGCAFALGGERLESAITVRIRVTHQHDLAFHVDAIFAKLGIVFGVAAVGVDHGRRNLAGNRHTRPGGTYTRILRVRVIFVRPLNERCAITNGSHHFQECALRRRAVDVVLSNHDIFQSLLLPLIRNVFGQFVIAG